MAVQVFSGASSDILTIDPTSKAARVTLYDSNGNESNKPPTGCYMANVNIRQTAATIAGTTVWAMLNSGTLTAFLRHIRVAVSFDGTASAATTLRYEIERFTVATPSGGTLITPVKKRNSYPSPSVGNVRFLDTGVTMTSAVFESPFHTIGVPASPTGQSVEQDLDFETTNERYAPLEIAVNEGLCIRLSTAAVIGMGLKGSISWDER